ncbi:hypothetical protein [Erythrobacter sp. R86502]|uniref:hypothetical protein n=1 Tax=Erythrobacter sp. R86502 TaxID=3093846 RepID=UPI0036D32BD3
MNFANPDPSLNWQDRWPMILLICLAAIIPLLMVNFPPLVDLYGHLGRYAVQTDLANRPELQPFYSYRWQLIGNLGADLLVQLLHGVLGLEGAVRFTVILTQLLGALGLLLIAREVHGRITPFAVAAIPLLYGYPFNYGFINYALSMALAMLAFVVWLRLRRTNRMTGALIWLGASGAGIWICHTYGWAFFGLLCGSAMLAQVILARMRPAAAVARIIGACWPLLLPIIPMAIWRAEATGAALSGWSFVFKLYWLISPLRTQWEHLDIGSVFVIVAALVLMRVLVRWFVWDLKMSLAAIVCFAAYAILPSVVFGSAFADMRLLPYAFALALLAVRMQALGPKANAFVSTVAIGFFAARMVITGTAYVVQDREIQAELAALDKIPQGARVAFFVVKPCWAAWESPVLDHIGGAAIARRNAFVNDQWQQPGVNPMTVHYPAAGRFDRDPSHLTQREDCSHQMRPKLSESIWSLPLDAFTHVWIVGEVGQSIFVPPRLERVPYTGAGQLYTVTPYSGDAP